MTEDILVVGEQREDISTRAYKTLKTAGLFVAVLLLTTLLFYIFKPLYEYGGRKGAAAQSFCVVSLVIVAIIGVWLKKNDRLDYDALLKLLFVVGYILRVTYMLYTPVSVRQQDTYNKKLTGHEAYAWIIYDTGKLPTTNDYQFYHPPFNAICQAAFMKLTNALTEVVRVVCGWGNSIPSGFLSGMPKTTATQYVGLTAERYYLYSTTEILAVLWSVVTMLALVEILKLFKLKNGALVGISAILVFFPRHIQFAGQVNNDSIAYMFQILAVYYCLKWWKRGKKLEYLLLSSLSIGLGMASKISCATICLPIACVFVYEFVLAIKRAARGDKSDIPLWKLCCFYVLFLCVCAPIGLSFQVYAYKRFGQEFGFVFNNLNHALKTDHHSLFSRLFVTFDPNEYFGTLYCVPFSAIKDGAIVYYNNYNLFLYSLRSALFGEFTYKGGESFAVAGFASSLVAALSLFASVVYCVVLFFKNGRRAKFDKGELLNVAFIFALVETMVISEVYFYIKMPYACTQDFRYVMPLILGAAMTYYYSNKRIKLENTRFGSALRFISTASMAAMLVSTTLLYCVCSA